jgi:Mn2+/Fe2+ NRAMP family transporter
LHGVNWMLLAWCVMLVVTFFATGAMYGGVAQVLNVLVPSVPRPAWIVAEAILTLVILLGGHYMRIERLATLKVCLFTLVTVLAAAVLSRQPAFDWSDVSEGLRLQLPGQGLATAVAVFGITGVGAAELMMYPYWCVEKGYSQFAGHNDGSTSWARRAQGWIRVMNVDIVAAMLIYTTATVAFYLLGAGVLHARGLVPSATDMIPVLSRMYTETLGPWGTGLFYAGALATLYGTIFAFTAGNCRVLADIARLAGLYRRDDYKARVAWRDRFIWIHTVVPVALILAIGSPVQMVKWAGVAQAMMLPIIGLGAVYLRHKRLPAVLTPGYAATAGLWVAAAAMFVLMAYYAYLSL